MDDSQSALPPLPDEMDWRGPEYLHAAQVPEAGMPGLGEDRSVTHGGNRAAVPCFTIYPPTEGRDSENMECGPRCRLGGR